MTFQRLTRDQFSIALRHGHGRALMHSIGFGLAGVEDQVLEVCLNNTSYDSQSSPSRAMWLWWMFKDAEQSTGLSANILAALGTATDTWDLCQLCGVAFILARNGNISARNALRAFVLKNASMPGSDSWLGCRQWVRLDGEAAVIELARCYGKVRNEYPDEWRMETLDDLLSGMESRPQLEQALRRVASTDPDVSAYLAFVDERAQESACGGHLNQQELIEQFRARFPLERILADAASEPNDQRVSRKYIEFGRYATHEEKHAVLSRLAEEQDERVVLRLLSILRNEPSSGFHPRLLELAESATSEIRDAALQVLATIQNEQVGAFARKRLTANDLKPGDLLVLGLLNYNLQPGDETLIFLTLEKMLLTEDDVHQAGMYILTIASKTHSPLLRDLLLWSYENNPCEECRNETVQYLVGMDLLPETLLTECLYDSNEDTRLLASLLTFQTTQGRCPESPDELAAFCEGRGLLYSHSDHGDLEFVTQQEGTCGFQRRTLSSFKLIRIPPLD